MKLVYRLHAVRRMLQRQIGEAAVRNVVESGEMIASYPNDRPYPSRLLVGRPKGTPLHVLVADNVADNEVVVITVYEPDPDLWMTAFARGERNEVRGLS